MGCRLLDVSNSTLLREKEVEVEKREPVVQINRKPKRVRLGIDRDHVVDGQTKRRDRLCVCTVVCWSEENEPVPTRQSPYFRTPSAIDAIEEYDNTTY